MQENHLAKWLNNELSEEELTEFKNSESYATYERIADTAKAIKGPDFDVEEALMAFKNKQKFNDEKVIQLNPFKKFLRVAAIIALFISGAYFFLNTTDETTNTQFAERKEVVLPDASKVILNADSELSYNNDDWENNRNLNLKGEAFFKVAKGKRFTVTTQSGTITVLGTQFNVENRNDFFEVTCYEGLVSVTFNGTEAKLPAGSSFIALNGKPLNTNKINTLEPSWLHAESSFKSIPLQYVFKEFERQHNIKVETQNIDLNQKYTGSFSNTDANLALQSISKPSQIKFKLEGNKVLFYGENAQ